MLVIAISYAHNVTLDSNMEMFIGDDAPEKAKAWLISELYRSLDSWCEMTIDPDTGKEYEIWHSNSKDIKRALEKEPIEEIIEGLTCGDNCQIYYKCKDV